MNNPTCIVRFIPPDEIAHAQRTDPAKFGDNGLTNYELPDSARVRLLCETVAECSEGFATLAKGTIGTALVAQVARIERPPKATRTPRTFKYLALVQFQIGDVIFHASLPHNAIKELSC